MSSRKRSERDGDTESDSDERDKRETRNKRIKKNKEKSRCYEASSSSDEIVKKKKKKHKKKHKNKKKRSYSSDDESSNETSSCDSDRKSKKSKKKQKKQKYVSNEWGKYGEICETDFWAKKAEFQLWLMDVKNKAMEELSPIEEKLLFKDYMEDFNTATFPSKKYYDLNEYERTKAMKQSMKKESREKKEMTVFNDEMAKSNEIKHARQIRRQHDIKEAYNSMREDSEKVEAMKRQKELYAKMGTLHRMGQHDEAKKIAELLKPDT